MDVYLVPAGGDRFQLYCEASSPVAPDDAQSTIWKRLTDSFRRALAEGEAEHARDPTQPPRSDAGRLRRAITRKIAAVVSEQRVLWHLRNETHVRLFHPDTMDSDRALDLARLSLATDYKRHLRWFGVDALLTAITGPLFFFVPGPNVISWYFTFRAVGHYLSMRGAKQGLNGVTWTGAPTPHLSAVGASLDCDEATRAAALERASAALGLDRLATFVKRVAVRPA
jgi:hypothetical protein